MHGHPTQQSHRWYGSSASSLLLLSLLLSAASSCVARSGSRTKFHTLLLKSCPSRLPTRLVSTLPEAFSCRVLDLYRDIQGISIELLQHDLHISKYGKAEPVDIQAVMNAQKIAHDSHETQQRALAFCTAEARLP